jgi:hypothetical protein
MSDYHREQAELRAQGILVRGFMEAADSIREATKEYGTALANAIEGLAVDLDEERRDMDSVNRRQDSVGVVEDIVSHIDNALFDDAGKAHIRRRLAEKFGLLDPKGEGGTSNEGDDRTSIEVFTIPAIKPKKLKAKPATARKAKRRSAGRT